MRRLPTVISLFTVLFLLGTSAFANTPASESQVDSETKIKISENYGKTPLSFEINEGQVDDQVKFLSRGQGYNLFLTPTESVLALSRTIKTEVFGPVQPESLQQDPQPTEFETATVRMKLVNANPSPKVAGLQPTKAKTNYLTGNDPKKWRTNVSNYAKVKYEEVYPGIDLVYYGNQKKLEYDFIVNPGSDYKTIQMNFAGAEKLDLDDKGNLVLSTATGNVIQHAPVIYQVVDGERHTVKGNYVLQEENKVGFQVAQYDTEKPLVIDPVLEYSTYLGGNSGDVGLGIAVDSSGNAWVTGQTFSTDFPALNAIQGDQPDTDVFVAKISGLVTSPPVADFNIVSNGSLLEGILIIFQASGSSDSDGSIVNYNWDFGDGSSFADSGINASHIYDDNGTFTVTLTVTDDDGETGTVAYSVTVLNMAPTITVLGANPATVEVGSVYTDAGATTSDVTGDTVALSTSGLPIDTNVLGTHTVTYTAMDDDGDSSTAIRTVNVVDTTPPIITAPADVTKEATAALTAVVIGQATYTDNVGVVSISHDHPNISFPIGTTIVTWIARDGSGNSASATQKVTVKDTTAPVVTAPTAITKEATAPLTPVSLGTGTASDLVDGAIIPTASPTGPFAVGAHTITWTATDEAGNSASATQTVTVVDTTAPTVTVPPGSIIVEATALLTPVDLGTGSAKDLVDGDITPTPSPAGPFAVGVHFITWSATDAHNNIGTATQMITVKDTTPPTLTLQGSSPVTIEAGDPYHEFGATGFDLVDGDLFTATVNYGQLNTLVPAAYSVIYRISDAAGNVGRISRIVVVVDTTPPELTVPADVTVDATGDLTVVDIGTATATDIVGVTSISSDAPASYPVGVATVTWIATDATGNLTSDTQLITVLSPAEIMDGLSDDIANLNLPKGTQSSLNSKLDSANKALNDSNPKNDKAGVNSLEALINSIQAQGGKKISKGSADELIARIQNLIKLI